jgi:hypothetical protein
MLACEVQRRVLQPVCQPVEVLATLIELLLDLTAQGEFAGGEPGEQRGPFGSRDFGGGGGGRRPLIGRKVGNGEIGFVTDAADHR